MEKDTLNKRLAKYSALAIAAIAGVGSANAQIGYTDKSPGDVYNEPSTFSIDIDGDAQNDFSFTFYRNTGTHRVQTGTGGGTTYRTYGSTYSTYLHTMVPTTNTFTNPTYALYRTYNSFSNSVRMEGNNPSNEIMGSWAANALAKPNHVSSSNSFNNYGLLAYSSFDSYWGSSWQYGNFLDGSEHYVGVSFTNGTGRHYGWIRLSVNNFAGQVTIMDYGYEKTTYASIHAGGFPTTFTDAGSGAWNDPSNWDKGIPTEADDAVIPAGQSVTLDANATCFNFINDGNTSIDTYTLGVGGHFKSTGNRFNGASGTVSFTGNFVADATRKITGGALKAVGLIFNTVNIDNPNESYILDYVTDITDFNIQSCYGFTNESGNTLRTDGDVTINGQNFYNEGIFESHGNLTNNSYFQNINTFDVFGNLTNTYDIDNWGTFTLKSNATQTASLLNSGAMYGTGTYTMERYVTGSSDGLSNPNGRYWYLASPFTDATSNVFDAAGTNKVWTYNESGFAYTEITDNTTALDTLAGYVARLGSDVTLEFTGTNFNDDDLSVSGLTRTGTSTPKRGFHLMGNPYPSSVDWDAATKTNLEPTMWYRTANLSSTMVYDTYNSSLGFGTNNNGNGDVTKDIPPMQAFWVYVNTDLTTGTLGFTDAMRSHQNRSTLKTSKSNSNMMRLAVSNGVNSDEAIVYFNPLASDNVDDFDSHKMFNDDKNVPEIYTLADGQELVINGLQDITSIVSVPLGFKTEVANQFSITATELNFDAGQSVYLKDNLLNVVQDLKTNPEYSFSSNIANTNGRFEILFDINTSVSDDAVQSDVLVFANNNQLTVSIMGENNPEGELFILNLLGQEIYAQKITEATTTINQTLATGTYLVKVQTKEQTITKKIVVK